MRLAALLLLVTAAVRAEPLGGRADDLASRSKSRATVGVLAGLFDFTDETYHAAELGVQYRGSGRWWIVHPMAGGMLTSAGALNLYVGFGLEVPLGRRVLVRAAFAPGYYDRGGSGKDLGSSLEFRSSLEIGWPFAGGWRLGVETYHLSNASLGRINPGNTSLVVVLTIPLGRRP